MMKSKLLIAIALLVKITSLGAQQLPVGYGDLEDYYRRMQLWTDSDSLTSFTVRPTQVDEVEILKWTRNIAKTPWGLEADLLSPQIQVDWNSHHPYYANNAGLTPSKGIQSLTSVGLSVKMPLLSIQIRPEFIASSNGSYDGFPETLSNRLWEIRYEWWNRIDTPEQFGDGGITKIIPGQSHALIEYKGFGLGFSTENLWWGPGRRQSLMMSNNARGFGHLTFRSTRPQNTPIGVFEWNLVAGRLEESGYRPPIRSEGNPAFFEREDDWRYLSAINIAYQPKWIPGLVLGGNRSVQQYAETARNSNDYLPVFINLFRQNDNLNRQEQDIDQLISFYFRWRWKQEQAEIYFEFGRNDAALNIRDLLLGPQHSRAYIFGLSKIFGLKTEGRGIEVIYEHTQLQQSASYLLRNAQSWYLHSQVRHGYTHRGEVLGASIGPGSNMDFFGIALVEGLRKYGLRIERVSNNNDFFFRAFENTRDWRRFWVDYNIGIDLTLPYKQFLFDGSLIFTRSLNYQWELFENPNNQPYFVAGEDASNLYFSLKTLYLF